MNCRCLARARSVALPTRRQPNWMRGPAQRKHDQKSLSLGLDRVQIRRQSPRCPRDCWNANIARLKTHGMDSSWRGFPTEERHRFATRTRRGWTVRMRRWAFAENQELERVPENPAKDEIGSLRRIQRSEAFRDNTSERMYIASIV